MAGVEPAVQAIDMQKSPMAGYVHQGKSFTVPRERVLGTAETKPLMT